MDGCLALRWALLVTIASILLGAMPSDARPFEDPECSSTDTSTTAMERCINAVRRDPRRFGREIPCDISKYRPARPLARDSALTRAAVLHSEYQRRQRTASHYRWRERVPEAGYRGWEWSENVAFFEAPFNGVKDIVTAWMCSPGHMENLMNCEWEHFGTGFACEKGRWGMDCYYTQEFGVTKNGQC